MVLIGSTNCEKRKIPNFFIVGAAKSGTTSLYHYLNAHPDVYMSPIKEPNFFSKDIEFGKFEGGYKEPLKFNQDQYFSKINPDFLHIAYIKDLETYLKLFEKVNNEKAIGEASTSYLYSKVAAKEIYNFNPDARIIIMLRNPVDRAFSHYLMNLQIGLSDNSDFLSEFYNDMNKKEKGWGISHLYLELGLYYEQVKRYLEVFPRERVKIIIFEEFKRNPEGVFGEILSFLNISKKFSIDLTQLYNQAIIPRNLWLNKKIFFIAQKVKGNIPVSLKEILKNIYKKVFFSYKKPVLNDSEKRELFKFFKDDVEKLEELLGGKISNWWYFDKKFI